MGEREGLNYVEIFREFNKRDIKYILCGGVALNIYGVPRMTYDIDILLKMDVQNIRKFLNLLKKWGFKPRAPLDIMDFAEEAKREKWIKEKNMKAFSLYNDKWVISEIDVLINVSLKYEDAIKNVVYKKIADVRVPLISLRDLIKMKQATGRKQDKADVRLLRELYKI